MKMNRVLCWRLGLGVLCGLLVVGWGGNLLWAQDAESSQQVGFEQIFSDGPNLGLNMKSEVVSAVLLCLLPFFGNLLLTPAYWIASKFLCSVSNLGVAFRVALYFGLVNAAFSLMAYFSGIQQEYALFIEPGGQGHLDTIQLLLIAAFGLISLGAQIAVPMEVYAISALRSFAFAILSFLSFLLLLTVTMVFLAVLANGPQQGLATLDKLPQYFKTESQPMSEAEVLERVNRMRSMVGLAPMSSLTADGGEASASNAPVAPARRWTVSVGDKAQLTRKVDAVTRFGKMPLAAGSEVDVLSDEGNGQWKVRYRAIEATVPVDALGPVEAH